jgi:4,5-DOPA dioxygenase extradiol
MADLQDNTPYPWAEEFDVLSKQLIDDRDHTKLINYQSLGRAAQLSIPTPEHYLPLLYALALQGKSEDVTFFNEEMVFKSGSMRSVRIG